MTPHQKMITPCRNICIMDAPSGLCEGCGRTLAEIGGWLRLSHAEREAIMRDLPARLRRLRDLAASTGKDD